MAGADIIFRLINVADFLCSPRRNPIRSLFFSQLAICSLSSDTHPIISESTTTSSSRIPSESSSVDSQSIQTTHPRSVWPYKPQCTVCPNRSPLFPERSHGKTGQRFCQLRRQSLMTDVSLTGIHAGHGSHNGRLTSSARSRPESEAVVEESNCNRSEDISRVSLLPGLPKNT